MRLHFIKIKYFFKQKHCFDILHFLKKINLFIFRSIQVYVKIKPRLNREYFKLFKFIILDSFHSEENTMPRQKDEEELKQQEEDTDEEDEEFTETYDYIEEIACLERRTSSRSTPQVIESSDDEGEMEEEEAETKELDGMISVKSTDEEGSRVKKFIVSYETKVLKSPSPAPSHGNYQCYLYSCMNSLFVSNFAKTL